MEDTSILSPPYIFYGEKHLLQTLYKAIETAPFRTISANTMARAATLFAFVMGFALLCYLSHPTSDVSSGTQYHSGLTDNHSNNKLSVVFPDNGIHRRLLECCGCQGRSCQFCCKPDAKNETAWYPHLLLLQLCACFSYVFSN